MYFPFARAIALAFAIAAPTASFVLSDDSKDFCSWFTAGRPMAAKIAMMDIVTINSESEKPVLMVGDSITDSVFAENNGFEFRHIDPSDNGSYFLDNEAYYQSNTQ